MSEPISFFDKPGNMKKACQYMGDETPLTLKFYDGREAHVIIKKLFGDYMLTRFIRDGKVDEESRGFQELDDIVDVIPMDIQL